MRTMNIAKKLLFDDDIKAINKLTAQEKLTYQKEEDGSIRASGPLFISGEMVCSDGHIQSFQEVLDMDILAPAYKLGSETFQLNVESVDHKLETDGVEVSITLGIKGLQERADNEDTPHSITSQTSETLVTQEETNEEIMKEDTSDEEVEQEVFEDLFEDANTTYTTYRMIVALANDSYASIAKRYDVKEEELQAVNRNKDILAKTLIVLPF